MANFELSEVITVPEGTWVLYYNSNQCDWEKPGPCRVVFRDSNGNQELDGEDLKLSYYMRTISRDRALKCKGVYYGPSRSYYCITKVNWFDIEEFGKRTNRLFRSSQAERKQLLRLLEKKSFAEGICLIDDTVDPKNQITNCRYGNAKFDPPLSLKTRWTNRKFCNTSYGGLKMGDGSDLPTLDPRQCIFAKATFEATLGGQKIRANFRFGDDRVVLFDFGILQMCGLSNARDVPDVEIPHRMGASNVLTPLFRCGAWNTVEFPHCMIGNTIPYPRAHLDLGRIGL